MEICAVFVLALFLPMTWCMSPRRFKQYRTDYEYNSRVDAFYKLHVEPEPGWISSQACFAEGAALMVASTAEDLRQVHGMFKRYPNLGEYIWVGLDGEQHESAEERPLIYMNQEEDEVSNTRMCDLVTRKGEIDSYHCFRRLPFICKVKAEDAPYDARCDAYGNDYQYNSTVGSCYRIPRMTASWDAAYAECRAENAHLLVINSEAEQAVVRDIIKATPKVPGARTSYFFYAGFRAAKPVGNETVVFKTIFNETLQEAGFAQWSPNEPNNALGNEYCGTVFKNDGKFNDVDCSHEYAFVCEKEVSREAKN